MKVNMDKDENLEDKVKKYIFSYKDAIKMSEEMEKNLDIIEE
jgi:hypothetical protein